MNFLASIEKVFTPARLASVVTGLLFFILVTQKYINERFSLLERAGVGLILLIAVIYFTKTQIRVIYVSIPAALLTLAMGISVIQMPATFIIRDYVAYFLIAVFSVILISAFGVGAARNGVIIGLIFLLCANIVVLVTAAAPDIVGAYKFAGTSYGSNTLAASMVICLPAVLSLKTHRKLSRVVAKFSVFLVAAYFIFLTGALTALVTLLTIVVFWSLYLVAHKWRKFIPWLWACAGVTLAIIALNVSSLLGELGKNSSMSGRLPLWQAYLDKIWENPIIGYGWSFQTRTDMPLGLYISQVMGVPLSNAHDDLLNWWAQTGIFGAIFFAVVLASIIILGFKSRKVSPYGLWLFFTGIVFGINGIAELTSMYADGWFVLMLASAAISVTISKQPSFSRINRFLVLKHNLAPAESQSNK
jgi:O-antigen ligase